MNNRALPRLLIKVYVGVFLFYMLAPLIVMGGAALNDSRFPSVFPWVGFTSRWFVDLWNDDRMLHAARNTVLIALSVVDKEAFKLWLTSNKKTRLKKFSPSEVRRALERQEPKLVLATGDWYARFCESYSHISSVPTLLEQDQLFI